QDSCDARSSSQTRARPGHWAGSLRPVLARPCPASNDETGCAQNVRHPNGHGGNLHTRNPHSAVGYARNGPAPAPLARSRLAVKRKPENLPRERGLEPTDFVSDPPPESAVLEPVP